MTSGEGDMTHVVDSEIRVTCRDSLAIHEPPAFKTLPTYTSTRELQAHQSLHEIFLVLIQEVGQLARVQTRVQFQETPQRGHFGESPNVREEDSKMALGRIDGGRGKVGG